MIQLGVNIDHVATIRQARYRDAPGDLPALAEPDPVRAAHEAELGGADGITFHLREDRRHIHDRDVERLKDLVRVKLNFEMGPTQEMVRFACRIRPHTSMLVPEGRTEVTTEGGLNVAGNLKRIKDAVARLKSSGMVVSAFIDADLRQVEAAAKAGFDVCEVHTGPYAHAHTRAGGDLRSTLLMAELSKVADAGEEIMDAGMRFNAGHALNYHNVSPIAAMPGISELHIGHSIVSRAVFTGLRQAVYDMKTLMINAANHG